LRRVLKIRRPDVLYVWNLGGVSVSMVLLAQSQGVPCCYFVSDDWLSRWEEDLSFSLWHSRADQGRIKELEKAVLRSVLGLLGVVTSDSLDLRHVQFASEHLKRLALRAGKPVDNAEVIHWGIDAAKYPFKETSNVSKHLLYVGQLVPHKGVHTTIEAIKILVHERGCSSVRLTIAGSATLSPEYALQLQDLVRRHSLTDNVAFTGHVPRERMPEVFHNHDILLFPSVWDEPFSIALLEGLSCGLAVVATGTGGTPEILQHDVNALLFPKENAAACADQILRLLSEEASFERIRRNGRRTVEKELTLESMIDRIENSLTRITATSEFGQVCVLRKLEPV
jgi:glycosyltransferase involved in cell wall biosynthesis